MSLSRRLERLEQAARDYERRLDAEIEARIARLPPAFVEQAYREVVETFGQRPAEPSGPSRSDVG